MQKSSGFRSRGSICCTLFFLVLVCHCLNIVKKNNNSKQTKNKPLDCYSLLLLIIYSLKSSFFFFILECGKIKYILKSIKLIS